jgi:hypothetical protein
MVDLKDLQKQQLWLVSRNYHNIHLAALRIPPHTQNSKEVKPSQYSG